MISLLSNFMRSDSSLTFSETRVSGVTTIDLDSF